MKKALVAFLVFNACVQAPVAAMLLFAPESAAATLFEMTYGPSSRQIVAALGVAVSMSTILVVAAVRWTLAGDPHGMTLAVLFGAWAALAGAIYIVQFGQVGGVFDLARGLGLIALVAACRGTTVPASPT